MSLILSLGLSRVNSSLSGEDIDVHLKFLLLLLFSLSFSEDLWLSLFLLLVLGISLCLVILLLLFEVFLLLFELLLHFLNLGLLLFDLLLLGGIDLFGWLCLLLGCWDWVGFHIILLLFLLSSCNLGSWLLLWSSDFLIWGLSDGFISSAGNWISISLWDVLLLWCWSNWLL